MHNLFFKRGDPDRPEEEVLMRALRDFNIPKIVTEDFPVFMGLIGDLFPALEVPRKRDAEFERTVKQAAMDLGLQPEDNFILKVKFKSKQFSKLKIKQFVCIYVLRICYICCQMLNLFKCQNKLFRLSS